MLDRDTLMRMGWWISDAMTNTVTAPLPAEWLVLIAKLDAVPSSGPVTD